MTIKKIFLGHRAVVTGASSGIGQEYARQLACLGCDLVIVARRLDRLESLAGELKATYGVQVTCLQADLTLPGMSKSIFQKSTMDGGKITLLINNAGIGKYGAFTEANYPDHQSTVQVNLMVLTELSYEFVKHMLEHEQQSYIVQVASIAGIQPVGHFAVYSGTKAYVRAFSEVLAFELVKSNVHVMCLCPGGTWTDFFYHSGQVITASGRMTMMSSQEVVRLAIQAMLNKKRLYIPGFINKIACFLPRFLPRNLALYLAFQAMSRSVKKQK